MMPVRRAANFHLVFRDGDETRGAAELLPDQDLMALGVEITCAITELVGHAPRSIRFTSEPYTLKDDDPDGRVSTWYPKPKEEGPAGELIPAGP